MTDPSALATVKPPQGATAVVVLADATLFWGRGAGAHGAALGEICFNTSMTGYQEILTDPSYAGQIVTFTFPHIGNVGTTPDDLESQVAAARGVILRAAVTEPSNFRAEGHLDGWLKAQGLVGVSGIDTRALTRRIREGGAPTGVVAHDPGGRFDLPALLAEAQAWPGLDGMDLAKEVTTAQTYTWDRTVWRPTWGPDGGYGTVAAPDKHVIVLDYGVKRNILRHLAGVGCRLTVLPATATADEVLGHDPDGVFLSNGPGDPAATGAYAVPTLRALLARRPDLPMFGICLGHQMLALALGAKTEKLHLGHRGANQPVQDLETGKVEITSQNHGFVVTEPLPDGLVPTHRSLFDGCLEGFRVEGKPIFAVQYHPEASPGPKDSAYLFDRFRALLDGQPALGA